MNSSMLILLCLLAVFYVEAKSDAPCCDKYEDLKAAIVACEDETKAMKGKINTNEICYGLTCVATKWGVMVDGKLNTEHEESLFTKMFPEASNNLKSKLLECSAEANDQSSDCQVLVKTYNCVFGSADHRRELDSLIQKREDGRS